MNICANNNSDHLRNKLLPVLYVLYYFLYHFTLQENKMHRKQPLKLFLKKDVFLKIAALTVGR